MSYIDILVLSTAYYRHDDRQLWDVESLFGTQKNFTKLRNIAMATRATAQCPGTLTWPAGQVFGDSTLGEDTAVAVTFDPRVDFTGNSGYPYRIRGFALDSVGAGVSNAEMQLFRTSDDAYLRSSVSVGSSGQYDIGTDDTTTAHYIVAYRTGPDIEGTTVNTLVGS